MLVGTPLADRRKPLTSINKVDYKSKENQATPRVRGKLIANNHPIKSPLALYSVTVDDLKKEGKDHSIQEADENATPKHNRISRGGSTANAQAAPGLTKVLAGVKSAKNAIVVSTNQKNELKVREAHLNNAQTRLQQELAAARAEIVKAHRRIDSKEIELSALRKQSAESDEKQKRQIELLKRLNEKASSQIHTLKDEFQKLIESTKKSNLASNQQLKQALEDRDQLLLKLNQFRDKAKQCLESQKNHSNQLEQERTGLQSKLEELNQINASLQAKILDYEQAKADPCHNKASEELEQRLERLELERQVSKDALKKALAVLKESETQQLFKAELSSKDAKIKDLEAKLAHLNTQSHDATAAPSHHGPVETGLDLQRRTTFMQNSILILQQKASLPMLPIGLL